MSIVEKVFQNVRNKLPPPIPTPTKVQTPLKTDENTTNPNSLAHNYSRSQAILGTPSRPPVKRSTPKVAMQARVPKTPQPAREARVPRAPSVPTTPKSSRPATPIDAEASIKVYVRVRPQINDEVRAPIEINENEIAARPPQKSTNHYAERNYSFTKVYDESSSQKDIFNGVAMPILKQFIKGYDGLLFAYGATSAGKTFTVRGSEEDPGLIPSSVRVLLATPPPDGFERGLFISCVEVYNERIHDLLGDAQTPLRLGKDGFGFTVVKGVKEVEIRQAGELKQILETIDNNKKVCSTAYNAASSRSHCIFMLKLISIPIDRRTGRRTEDIRKITASRLSIVDLAGSERVDPSETSSKMVSEACNINKSMLVLGRCIREIRRTQMGVRGVQVPFRESKITELFRDFFDPVNGRKTYCSIIVNISPSTKQLDDTLFALQFAAEAVKCSVHDNSSEDDDDDLPMDAIDFDDDNYDNDDNDDSNDHVINEAELQAKEARIRQEIRNEMTDRLKKIQSDYQVQLEQIRAQSQQPYTSKLQQALAQRLQNESRARELEEAKRDRDRALARVKELEAQIGILKAEANMYKETVEQLQADLRASQEKNTGMESAIQKMIEGTKRIHQRQIDLQAQFETDKQNMKDFYERKIAELTERLGQ